jgi:hypothetical protein
MKTRSELNSLITTDINTNSNGEITAAKVRNILNETVDSYVHKDDKDATGGVPGLTLFKINFKNVANTFTSFFTNSNTAARTYTFQNRNGTIADDTDLALKANLASPTFTGTVVLPSTTSIDTVSATEISYLDGVSSSIQNQLNAKVNLNTLITAGTGLRVTYDAKGLILSSENCNVQTVTSSATVTAISTNDLVEITAQAAGLTLANPTGTFYNGQILNYRIKDNATARAITFGSKFLGFGSALPTTTTISKWLLISCQYNSATDKFETLNSLEQ